jgi:hypothetical protein
MKNINERAGKYSGADLDVYFGGLESRDSY